MEDSQILALLKDPDKEVRRRAAWDYSHRLPTIARPLLVPLLRDESWHVRSYVLMGLHSLDDEATFQEVLPVVINCLQDEHAEVRRQAADALRTFSWRFKSFDREEVMPRVLPLLEDQNLETQAQAAHTLATWGYAPAVARLIALVNSADSGARTFALRGVRYLQLKEAIPAVLAALEQIDHPQELASVLDVLSIVQSKEAIPVLVRFLSYRMPESYAGFFSHVVNPKVPDSLTTGIRRSAAQTLKQLNEPQTLELVRPLLDDPDENIRELARDLVQHFEKENQA
ncbi:MAG TPA: HEAT repeat domain-containing protein [Chloroflexia bacterium]|nr:HEAT repeat domain-containing protein [Chloroflexia bacterium]